MTTPDPLDVAISELRNEAIVAAVLGDKLGAQLAHTEAQKLQLFRDNEPPKHPHEKPTDPQDHRAT